MVAWSVGSGGWIVGVDDFWLGDGAFNGCDSAPLATRAFSFFLPNCHDGARNSHVQAAASQRHDRNLAKLNLNLDT